MAWMRATLVIRIIGHSPGYAITDDVARALDLHVGDSIVATTSQIINDKHVFKVNVVIPGRIIKSGGTRGGVIIDRKLARALGIQKGTVIDANLEKS